MTTPVRLVWLLATAAVLIGAIIGCSRQRSVTIVGSTSIVQEGDEIIYRNGGVLREGSGKRVSAERPLTDACTAIDHRAVAQLSIINDGTSRIVIEGDENLLDLITTVCDHGTLRISHQPGSSFKMSRQFRVTVHAPGVDTLRLHHWGETAWTGINVDHLSLTQDGSGYVRLEGRARAADLACTGSGSIDARTCVTRELTVRLDGSGDISATCQGSQVTATITGMGNLRLTGRAERADLRVAGTGDILGGTFDADQANAEVSGLGDIDLGRIGHLDSKVTGLGRVRCRATGPESRRSVETQP